MHYLPAQQLEIVRRQIGSLGSVKFTAAPDLGRSVSLRLVLAAIQDWRVPPFLDGALIGWLPLSIEELHRHLQMPWLYIGRVQCTPNIGGVQPICELRRVLTVRCGYEYQRNCKLEPADVFQDGPQQIVH